MGNRGFIRLIQRLGPKVLPFADAATKELPLPRLLRLSLFQISVGLELVLLNGTLNRVMIVELGIAASLVAAMIALPILIAPLRALIGFRSDNHRSALGWRRVPYIWMGTMAQFGGLALLPFAMLVLSGRGVYSTPLVSKVAVALAIILIGGGLHMAQTAGVALATDLAPEESRPRVVALLYTMLLVGMVGASLAFGALLQDFSYTRLVQIIQGAAVVTLVLNVVALWKQEPRVVNETGTATQTDGPTFTETFRDFLRGGPASRLLVATGLGGAGFSMQDILLEPYGGELLHLSVSATTALTALMAGGTLIGLFVAARALSRGYDPNRLAALGALIGIFGFAGVIFASPLSSVLVFCIGTFVVGYGGGWFSVGTLISAMGLAEGDNSGIAIGAWGAVQATVMGLGITAGGGLRDLIGNLAVRGALGPGLVDSSIGYSFVYHVEILLLFGTLVAIGPLVRLAPSEKKQFGLAELPN